MEQWPVMYSTSHELFDIVSYFFDLKDIREFSRYTLKSVTDYLKSLQMAQSLSQKTYKRLLDGQKCSK